MWSEENRVRYERKGLRYPSDLTDEEWALVEPHLPPPRQKSRHPSPDRRRVLNAILYVLSTGCQWRALPTDFPPRSTVHDYFIDWHGDGTLTRLHHALYAEVRELSGKEVIVYDYVDSGVAMLARMALKRQTGYRSLGYELANK